MVKTANIADVIGVARETAARILNELRTAGRIRTRRLGLYGGLVITFSDVIYSAPAEAAQPVATPENDALPAPEETTKARRVSSHAATGDHSLSALAEAAAWWEAQPPVPAEDWGSPAERQALADELLAVGNVGAAWWIVGSPCSVAVPTLADAVQEAFDAYAARPFVASKRSRRPVAEPVPGSDDDKRRRIKRKARGARRAPITRQMVAHYVAGNFPALSYTDDELVEAIAAERQRRKFAELPNMMPGALRAEIRLAEHLADTSRIAGNNAWRWWLVYRDAARRELASRRGQAGERSHMVCEVLPSPADVAAQHPYRQRERLPIYRPGVPPMRLPLADLPDMIPRQVAERA